MFETIYTILTRLDASEDVLGFWEPAEGSTHFRVDLNDFEGFTDEGEEITWFPEENGTEPTAGGEDENADN